MWQPGFTPWRGRGGGIVSWDWAPNLWDLMMSLHRRCQNWDEFQDTQLASENCLVLCGNPPPLPPHWNWVQEPRRILVYAQSSCRVLRCHLSRNTVAINSILSPKSNSFHRYHSSTNLLLNQPFQGEIHVIKYSIINISWAQQTTNLDTREPKKGHLCRGWHFSW